ncbi:MAG TPA: 4Fe-4S ferredoxin [Anaerolineae bacterium]|nr:4Fe-4S ferredoxin [Anaerolineae bacterium]
MRINPDACTGCELCLPYCPMGAISMAEGRAKIDRDECVECGVCLRSAGCPADAFVEEELSWPRSVRAVFSNPLFEHRETRIPGRGTEEVKTNDVTGRFRRGYAGVAVELGRPGTGARFRDVERVTRAMAAMGVKFEPNNPVTFLMVDQRRGRLNPELLDEKVLSAIVEFTVPLGRLPAVLTRLREVAREVETVFSLNVICKVEPDDSVPTVPLIEGLGIPLSINGKNCVGLGRPLFVES